MKFCESLIGNFTACHMSVLAASASFRPSVVKEACLIYIRAQRISLVIGRLASEVKDGGQIGSNAQNSLTNQSPPPFTQWACLRTFLDLVRPFTGISAFNRRQERVFSCYLFIYCRRLIIFKMLCLCLYVPVHNSDQIEVDYFESNGLPSELKSLKSLSVLLPSQEFSTYRKWRKVRNIQIYIFLIVM